MRKKQTKEHKLVVRITEEQLIRLSQHIKSENTSKSIFLRDIIEKELKKLS